MYNLTDEQIKNSVNIIVGMSKLADEQIQTLANNIVGVAKSIDDAWNKIFDNLVETVIELSHALNTQQQLDNMYNFNGVFKKSKNNIFKNSKISKPRKGYHYRPYRRLVY